MSGGGAAAQGPHDGRAARWFALARRLGVAVLASCLWVSSVLGAAPRLPVFADLVHDLAAAGALCTTAAGPGHRAPGPPDSHHGHGPEGCLCAAAMALAGPPGLPTLAALPSGAPLWEAWGGAAFLPVFHPRPRQRGPPRLA